ncbi:hypothetical protein FC83_GL000664 [Agrilactobacillus composti DSM 18527 = JCM 14202]|uniref:Uncharacterized protein n=1 Tax=Agrilactobacillus composti DSM 18527 = JCM 14202 TaxID=1423734 RepID=X0PDW4_9LACO|nr:hypothetical protein [Agrilactobacillus composti]KRM31601.1 hypothetical protein FC83_GL000664 [Agrilactobacillus composti DSM 18527 = JCM 14202]GAF39368.1 hypothetical protein JCM14202_1227 [Agrilactobacillus composti DSM 18527 = JCM 14202]
MIILNSGLKILIAVLTTIGIITIFVRSVKQNSNKFRAIEMDFIILFLGLGMTIVSLNYFSIFIATLGSIGVFREINKLK